jgi:RNA 2',3'-cyclic 3'-phosphodiesterase
MRLFLALPLPDVWRERLKELQTEIPDSRWVSPSKYHITLQFLGAKVNPELFPEIVRRVEPLRMRAFEIEVEGLGRFKSRQRSTVLWARVCQQPTLTQLHTAIAEAMAAIGLGENGAYQPHITLCYLGKTNIETQLEELITQHADFRLPPFEAREFVLYESKNGEYVSRAMFSLDD